MEFADAVLIAFSYLVISDTCSQPKIIDITRTSASTQSTRSLLRCSTAGRIGKAKIRTLKMTLVIGK